MKDIIGKQVRKFSIIFDDTFSMFGLVDFLR